MISSPLQICPKLIAFDLDGTLLNSQKEISPNNNSALHEMAAGGLEIVLASGRLKSSIDRYTDLFSFPVSVLSLNGAAVYRHANHGHELIYHASLPSEFADYLIDHAEKCGLALNYYINDRLYAINNEKNQPWIDLYFNQTHTIYNFMDSLIHFKGQKPSKIILIGPPDVLNSQQHFFTDLWGKSVYICRTWDYYLEFLNPSANKGLGLTSLARNFSFNMDEVIAFGDSLNDIPMLEIAGYGVAVRNASQEVKQCANRTSPWSNDDDAVFREWEYLKKICRMADH